MTLYTAILDQKARIRWYEERVRNPYNPIFERLASRLLEDAKKELARLEAMAAEDKAAQLYP